MNNHQIILTKIIKILSFIYFVAGCTFLFLTKPLIAAMNELHSLLPESLGLLPANQSADHFWIFLVFSMMMMLVFSCRQISLRPFDLSWHQIHILSKGVSSLGFIFGFFIHTPSIAYLIGFFTDFPLCLLGIYIIKQFSSAQSSHAY